MDSTVMRFLPEVRQRIDRMVRESVIPTCDQHGINLRDFYGMVNEVIAANVEERWMPPSTLFRLTFSRFGVDWTAPRGGK